MLANDVALYAISTLMFGGLLSGCIALVVLLSLRKK